MALVALVGCAGHSRPGGPAPESEQPAAPLAYGQPGDLISARPMAGAPAGILAWRVIYHTRDQNGADVAASGIVLAPAPGYGGAVPAGGRKVITFGHGTTGLADACAPSLARPALSAVGSTFELVAQGYVVAAADYIGLGTPGRHAIYIAGPEGQALLDAARAAQKITAVRTSDQVIIWGYSQGGQAALAAGTMAAHYAPELKVRGVVAMSPLADLPRSLASMPGAEGGVGYVLMAAYGVSVVDPAVDLKANLTSRGRHLLAIAQQKCAIDLIEASDGLTDRQVFVHDPLTTEPYDAVFAAQRTAVIGSMPPVLVLQGDADEVIRQPITAGVVRALCAAGTVVDYHRYPAASHSTIFNVSSPDLYAWIYDQFQDYPPPMHNICSPTL